MVNQIAGTEFIGQPLNKFLEYQAWTFLQLWYAPTKLLVHATEVDDFISQVSLNGMKSFNICKAN